MKMTAEEFMTSFTDNRAPNTGKKVRFDFHDYMGVLFKDDITGFVLTPEEIPSTKMKVGNINVPNEEPLDIRDLRTGFGLTPTHAHTISDLFAMFFLNSTALNHQFKLNDVDYICREGGGDKLWVLKDRRGEERLVKFDSWGGLC